MNTIKVIRLTVIIIAFLFTIAQAEDLKPAAFGQGGASTQAAPQEIQFPYVGEVTGTEINLRSGPGMNYYGCGKISSPLRVIVVDQQFSWSKILPPPGSFSWIFKQYVQTDSNTPDVGTVNADNVRVYAGSDEVEPMRSDSVQLTLSKGQKVKIIGQPIGEYYKISPPEGATLWTSSQYIKYVRSADEIDIKIPKTEIAPADANISKPLMIIEQVEPNNRRLEQYYVLEKQFQDEKAKPLAEQDFTKIKAELQEIVADANSGNAKDYAEYILKDIGRCELAKESISVLADQNEQLSQTLSEIEKTRQQKRQIVSDVGRYAIIGTFKKSLVYESHPTKRYLVVDDANKPICYAEPVGQAADANLAEFYGKKVGLVGQISADNQTRLALIRFEKIEFFRQEPKKE